MINNAFFLCAPVLFNNKFYIYPPKVLDVGARPNFNKYLRIFTMSQEEIEDELAEKINPGENFPTPYELLFANCYNSKEYEKIAKEAFYFFTHKELNFLYEQKKIIVGDLEEEIKKAKNISDLIFLDEEEFFDFQNIIRESMGEKPIEPPNPNEDPRVKRIKAKARYRDKIKAKKGMGLNFQTCIAAICCMGIGITPLNIGEMSYVAMETIMSVYQNKEKYTLDVDSLLAGADSKKIKPKYWIRNLEE